MIKKSPLGFGIVGCGMIGHFHAQAVSAMKNGKLICVFDLNIKAAEKLAAEHKCAAYGKYEEFLKHPGLDVVTIGTPSGAHLEPAVSAAKAKKHVICEKPLEINLERIDTMINTCRQNNVVLAGVHPRRFFPSVKEFKKAVDKGRFGKLVMADAYVKWFRTQDYYDSGGWRGTWRLDGGGALMNQSIHTIDQLYHLAGDVKSVCAFAKRGAHERIEVEDIAVAILEFKNGAMGTIEGSTSCFSKLGHGAEVHLCGTEGSVFMKDDSFKVWDFKKTFKSDEKILAQFGDQPQKKGMGAADPKAISYEGHKHIFEDAARAILKGEAPAIPGEEARKSVEIILAIYQSALGGGIKVTLPLKKSPRLKAFN